MRRITFLCLTSVIALSWLASAASQPALRKQETFRAAVYEHRRVPKDGGMSLPEWIRQNMLVFHQKAKEAAQQPIPHHSHHKHRIRTTSNART